MKTKTTALEEKFDRGLVHARKENIRRLNDIEHRLEYVDTVDGVEFINDAKAADINSAWYSIDCMEKPVVWIINSYPYEDDLTLLHELETSKIKTLIVLGNNPEAIESVFRGRVKSIKTADDIVNALRLAREVTERGDVVLYSPAFADMDDFTPYKENGQIFRKAVREVRL